MSGAKIILNDLYDKIDPENRQPQPFRQKHIDQTLADLRASVEWPEEKSTEGENYDIYNKHDLDGSFNDALKLCKEAFEKGMR